LHGKHELSHLKWMELFQIRQLLPRMLLSFHLQNNSHPLVEPLMIVLPSMAITWLLRDTATDGSFW